MRPDIDGNGFFGRRGNQYRGIIIYISATEWKGDELELSRDVYRPAAPRLVALFFFSRKIVWDSLGLADAGEKRREAAGGGGGGGGSE